MVTGRWMSLTYLWRHRFQATVYVTAISAVTVLILAWWLLFGFHSPRQSKLSGQRRSLEFAIKTKWNSQAVDHKAIRLIISPIESGLRVLVEAPFFNDPPSPQSQPGKPAQGLWDYEVVETYFLNDRKEYLEVELCPHGQHLVIMLKDYRKPFKDLLPLDYKAVIDEASWKGTAVVPWEYLPPGVNQFNAYAIHGSGEKRTYEALFPVPFGKFTGPDFHRLEYFSKVNFNDLRPSTASAISQYWRNT